MTMDRFKSILVAASAGHLEPPTLRAAVRHADANAARLTVMEVVAPDAADCIGACKWRAG